MVLCPLAMSDFSDADGIPADIETMSGSDFVAKVQEAGGTYEMTEDIYLTSTAKFQNDTTIIGNKHTIYGILSADDVLDDDEKDLKIPNIVISDLVFDGTQKNNAGLYSYGFGSQNQGGHPAHDGKPMDEGEPVRAYNLTLTGCIFQNYSDKGIYTTNVQNIVIDHCIFRNVAMGENGNQTEEIEKKDHAIDLCIGGVQNVNITITNNQFVDFVGKNASIQIQCRNPSMDGTSDDHPNDWGQFPVTTTIQNVYIANNDFSEKGSSDADIRLGSYPSAEKGERTSTKAFPATIIANGTTMVVTGTILGDGTSHPQNDFRVALDDGSVFEADGKLVETYDPSTGNTKKTGSASYNILSGSATVDGTLPDYMSLEVSEGATATVGEYGLNNQGEIRTYDGNLSGYVSGNEVDDTTTILPPIWDDDDEYVPPVVPVQPSDSGDDGDDTVTVVACAAAAVVAALLAAFLILDRKH